MIQPSVRNITISLLLVLSSLSMLAKALPDDARQNMSISADDYIFNVKTSTTTFVGNVVLQQGSLKINASKLVYYGKFDADNPSTTDKIVATGKPARFQQTPKLNSPPVVAEANRLEYSVKDESLFLIDNASLDQDGSSLRGNRIEYDVQQALVRASGNRKSNNNNGRIKMVIPPKRLSTIEKKDEKKEKLGKKEKSNTQVAPASDAPENAPLKSTTPESSQINSDPVESSKEQDTTSPGTKTE